MRITQLFWWIILCFLFVLSHNNEVEGTFKEIRDFFDRFFGNSTSASSSRQTSGVTTMINKLPPTTTAVPVKSNQHAFDFQEDLKTYLTESYPYPITPDSAEEFIKWEALEEKKYAEGILKKLIEPNDTPFDMEAKTLIANLVVNAVLDNVTHDSVEGKGNHRNVSARRTDGETALSSIVNDVPASGEWTYETQQYQGQSQQQPAGVEDPYQQQLEQSQQGQEQYEVPPGQQIQKIPTGQGPQNPTGQGGGLPHGSNGGYPEQSQGQVNAGGYPQGAYPNNPGDPAGYPAGGLPNYYPPTLPQPQSTIASYLGVINSIRNALTAATGNDTKALEVSPINSVLNLLGPRGPRTTPSPDESTEYFVVPVNPSTEKNTISAHQEDLLGQVGRLRENVSKRNISGVIDESLKLASLQTVGVFVTNFLDLLLCNPIDRWNGMCNV